MSEAYKKLIKTLQTIFEMDKADLDFGIYRIMNQKRDEINQFLEDDLLPQVKATLADFAAGEKTEVEAKLKHLIKTLTDAGVDPEHSTKVKELQEKVTSSVDVTVVENDVYSHLHIFFSRYYDKGDFISQRRYKSDAYAIPYEGEEVKLYWANQDQYYIKSSEHLRDYAFTVEKDDKKSVRIHLVEADTEKDNIKAKSDEERRFVLEYANPLAVIDGELIIRFQYVPKGKEKQEKLNSDAVKTIFGQEGFGEWLDLLKQKAPTEKKPDRTLLEKHLNDYTARNTFDYFIHKDLGGFLRRELDFYIKNEVFHLDDIDDAAFEVTEQHLRKIKVMRTIAHKLIRLLAQMEDFQKKLWLKKKFVVETNYCITLDRVPVKLYEEIASCSEQHFEWVKLGFTTDDTEITEDHLKKNFNLVLDTKFFDDKFKTMLLASIECLDEQCDGLFINSDNFQALNFLKPKMLNKIDCIHIDPPYNTATSGFLYKNIYEHSSWLSMMDNRISMSFALLSERGDMLCHVDENEYEKLDLLFDLYGLIRQGTIVWDKKNPMLGRKGIATQHEYVIWRSTNERVVLGRSNIILRILEYAESLIAKNNYVNERIRNQFKHWLSKQNGLSKGDMAYKYLDDSGEVFRLVAMGAPEKRLNPKFHIPLKHPITGKDCPVPQNGWSRTPETISELIEKNLIVFGSDESTQPQKKVFLRKDAQKQITSVHGDGKSGKAFLDKLGLEFPYCHPVSMYEHLLSSVQEESTLLDFFAGSGTNGHAVVNISRKYNTRHKSIMVENGKHFDNILKPRIQKVIFSDDWVNGKPVPSGTGVRWYIPLLQICSSRILRGRA